MRKNIKDGFIFLIACFIPVAAYPQSIKENLTAQEASAFSYLAGPKADGAHYMALLAPGYLLIDPAGSIYTADQSLAAFKACKFDSSQIKDVTVLSLSPTSALATVRVNLEGTCSGQKLPSDYVMVDAWVKRSGKWLIQLHTETIVVSQK